MGPSLTGAIIVAASPRQTPISPDSVCYQFTVVFASTNYASKIKEYGQASRTISTGSLNLSPGLHSRPINPVVFRGPLAPLRAGKPYLEAGFMLRCFQHLSLPNTATQRCPWQDNWDTGGSFNQVLSYCGRLLSSFLRAW